MDEPDFTAFYERHSRDVYRFSLYLSGDFALAEDLTAETFARAWIARERIRVGSVKAYLLMIARNLYRDVMRQRADSSLPDNFEIADGAPGPTSRRRRATSCGRCSVRSAGFRNPSARFCSWPRSRG